MKKYFLLFLSSLLIATACDNLGGGGDSNNYGGSSGSGVQITESKLKNYLSLYPKLKDKVPDVLELVNENEPEAQNHPQFAQLEQMLQDNNTDFQSFTALSAKIGTIYSFSEANMQTYDENNTTTLNQMDDMAKSIQEMIDDPNTPEAQKQHLRESLKRTQDGKEGFKDMFNNNREKAADQFQRARKKLSKVASDQEVDLIHKYKTQLQEAFYGISRPRMDVQL